MSSLPAQNFRAIGIKGQGSIFNIIDTTPVTGGVAFTALTGIKTLTVGIGWTLNVSNLVIVPPGSLTIGVLTINTDGSIFYNTSPYIHVTTLPVGSTPTNLGVGIDSLASVAVGANNNTAVGNSSMNLNTTGARNTTVGFESLAANLTGDDNTAVGYNALIANTTGDQNTAVGAGSLNVNVTGSNCVACGYQTLENNLASDNVGVGAFALNTNSTGTRNTAVGESAMLSNFSGDDNTAVGFSALNISTASNNVAVGAFTMGLNSTGTENVAVGTSALASNTTGANCSAFGFETLNVSTGADNTAVGHNALVALTTGTNNTAVGSGAGDSLPVAQNDCVLLNNDGATVVADGEVHLGNTVDQSLTFLHCPLVTDRVTSSVGDAAIPVTSCYHEFESTGTNTLTLADGTPGQQIYIVMVVDGGGTPFVDPATFASPGVLIFTEVGDAAHLLFSATVGWFYLGGLATIGPAP